MATAGRSLWEPFLAVSSVTHEEAPPCSFAVLSFVIFRDDHLNPQMMEIYAARKQSAKK